MRKLLQLIPLLIILNTIETSAQAPAWSWATSAGGASRDAASGISTDADGNVVVTGSFLSPSIIFGSDTLTNAVAGFPDIFVVKYDPSGNVLWATRAGGTRSDNGNAICTDAGGNIFVTGMFNSSSLTFDSITLHTSGLYGDIFIVKYSPSGNVLWATTAGGPATDDGYRISADAAGNVFVTGTFNGPSITFGSITLSNSGNHDLFVVKYSPSGNVLWATSAGGLGDDSGNGISTDAAGNVVVTGTFTSDTLIFGSTTLTKSGSREIFVVKYDSSGNTLWAASGLGTGDNGGAGISTDTDMNVIVTGYFKSPSITFGSTALTNVSAAGTPDIFVVKYSSSGNVVWATSAGGTMFDAGYGISTDAGGNVFVTGIFWSSSIPFGSTTLTNAGNSDIFVVKYDSSGNALWATRAGLTGDDLAEGISVDPGGDVFITGYFDSTSIAFGSIILNNADAGSNDIFVAKLDNVTGIEENIKNNQVSIFPNPFYNTTSISFSLLQSEKISVRIFDMNGRLIKTLADKIIFNEGEHQIVFNAEKLNAGIYLLKMESREFLKTGKLIIAK